jgi:hypothetical protein
MPGAVLAAAPAPFDGAGTAAGKGTLGEVLGGLVLRARAASSRAGGKPLGQRVARPRYHRFAPMSAIDPNR